MALLGLIYLVVLKTQKCDTLYCINLRLYMTFYLFHKLTDW